MKVGVFGGTFNPPHNGHISAVSAFMEAATLDRLLIIPTFIPPHKTVSGVSTNDRFEMAKEAFGSIPNVFVSDMEIKRGGVSYTADTLTALQNGTDKLYLLCGTDMFLSLDTWFHPETVFRLATVCYVKRNFLQSQAQAMEEKRTEYIKKYKANILPIENTDTVDISSSQIREAFQKGADVSSYLPKRVYSYMLEKRLYR